MKKLLRLLQLNFLPRSADAGLLVLRVWIGLSLLLIHGKGKLLEFSQMAPQFPDPLGVGSTTSLALTVFGEVFCAGLLVLGAYTRLAALGAAVTMAVAFFIVHKASLETGPGSGELAFIYLAGFVALFISGPGRFALDAKAPRSEGPGK